MTQDPFWDNAATSIWSVVELNCGIACATLPTLRPLLRKVFPSVFGSDASKTGYGSGFGTGATGPTKGSRPATAVPSVREAEFGQAQPMVATPGIHVRHDVDLRRTGPEDRSASIGSDSTLNFLNNQPHSQIQTHHKTDITSTMF